MKKITRTVQPPAREETVFQCERCGAVFDAFGANWAAGEHEAQHERRDAAARLEQARRPGGLLLVKILREEDVVAAQELLDDPLAAAADYFAADDYDGPGWYASARDRARSAYERDLVEGTRLVRADKRMARLRQDAAALEAEAAVLEEFMKGREGA